ncbi:MAG: hypothetical protein IIY78_04820 [Clostridia bacterium]|nr:hypothetical protein [Clostridia bacterium]
MGWQSMNNNVVIDYDAFNRAIDSFYDLSVRLNQLRSDIDDLLNQLKAGFDTPAGRKFMSSCENNLLTPLERQRSVIEHISNTLKDVETNYNPVFDEYRSLTSTINSYSE